MAYVLAGGLIALGAWLILDRNRFALENARWHRTKMPDSADPKVRRLSAFGFALLGVVIGGTGLYVMRDAKRANRGHFKRTPDARRAEFEAIDRGKVPGRSDVRCGGAQRLIVGTVMRGRT
ncbi:MAG: hypothetical protein E6J06_05420 [Chloroflexi bacterium]|nr:MAG: hypothetical protein E6J06_05420 [Chloroflexota bacterium]